jgi:diguanylate cyclase (GGDEF)-like protein/putative nucleotidyltransferase with HDIG domain
MTETTEARTSQSPAAGSLARSVPWTLWIVALATGAVLLLGIDNLFHPLPSGVTLFLQKFASTFVFSGAAALCFLKGRSSRDERAAWRLLSLAMLLWGAASAYYSFALWDREQIPIPSVADGMWLAFYIPAYIALYKLMRRRVGSLTMAARLDVLIGSVGVGGAAAALVFSSVTAQSGRTFAANVTNLAYPIGDLGLLVLVVAAITVVGWRASGAWRWLAPAFGLFAVADSTWLVQIADGTYKTGGVLDVGWPAAGLLVALAAWRSTTPTYPAVRVGSSVGVPALFGLGAVVLLGFDSLSSDVSSVATVLAAATLVLILGRLYLTARENSRMLAVSEREAMTDALTGLGNRRRLMADLAAQIEGLDPERPLMLTVFDLDGFKHYNDTFGHIAGDQLLQRLTTRLRGAADGRGSAYRMGGDEFCAVWDQSALDEASLAAMDAVEALSEHGEAFSIGCSYGSVVLPEEATTRKDALVIADGRMYTRKGDGRPSAGTQSADVLLSAIAERDSELGDHLGTVATLACATAAKLGVSPESMEVVRQTALLHDVGKVAIPDQILNKAGVLSDSEWAFIKRHTIIGERIISAAPALATVAKLVRSTHERYDGCGYPDALAGEDIPLIARILAVCDAYGAMVSHRVYRTALDSATAMAELRTCSRTQFDPVVVAAFAATLQDAEATVSMPAPVAVR